MFKILKFSPLPVSVYVPVAIIKKRLDLDASLYTFARAL